MSQSATITQSNGKSITVDINADDGKASNISDAEARAAFDAARAKGASDADLQGGQMTIGSTSLTSDRYKSLLGGNGADSADGSAPFLFSRHELSLGPVVTYYGGNGGELGYGLDLSYRYGLPVSKDGRSTIGVGGGFMFEKFNGEPSSIDLTQEDRDVGATGRDFTGSSLIMPHVDVSFSRYVSPKFSVGALAKLGINWMPGQDARHKLTGDQYSAAYCDPNGGGIFGGDVTGCENRPQGAFAQPGADNDTKENSSQTYFRAIVGPTAAYRFNDRMNLAGFAGLDLLAGGGPTRTGVTGGLSFVMGLDAPTPAKAEPVAVAPSAPPPTPKPSDKDNDGVADTDDKCPDVKGTKENKGCPAFEAKVTESPEAVNPNEKFYVGLEVGTTARARVSFKDAKGTLTNSNSVLIDEGNSKSQFDVPVDLPAGKYKLVVTFVDVETKVRKTEERDIVVVENVTADDMGTFAPHQSPVLKNIQVRGVDKLEGVAYEITGTPSGGKPAQTLAGTVPILDKANTQIIFGDAKAKKGFLRNGVVYTVTLKNKEGFVILTKKFDVGQAPRGGGGGRPRL